MDLSLDGKKILISGSTKGIGFECAKSFLTEGASVCISGRNKDCLLQREEELSDRFGKERVLCFQGDLQDEGIQKECITTIHSIWGKLDGLVLCVGNGKSQSENTLDLMEWKRMLNINLLNEVGLINQARNVLNKGSFITLISSIVSREVFGKSIAYAAGKSGIVTLTKYLSKEMAANQIRVNCISPGNVMFPGGRWEEIQKENPKAVEEMLKSQVPLRRFASAQEIADAVVFISSERAAFITGENIVVDGGQTSTVF